MRRGGCDALIWHAGSPARSCARHTAQAELLKVRVAAACRLALQAQLAAGAMEALEGGAIDMGGAASGGGGLLPFAGGGRRSARVRRCRTSKSHTVNRWGQADCSGSCQSEPISWCCH